VKLRLAVLVMAFALIPGVVRAAELSVTPTTIVWNPGQTPRITVRYVPNGPRGNSRVENGCSGLLVESNGREVNRTDGKWDETAGFTLRVKGSNREPCSIRFVYGEKTATVSVSFPQAERPANFNALLLDPALVRMRSGQSVRITARIAGPTREVIVGSPGTCRSLEVFPDGSETVSEKAGAVETVQLFTVRIVGPLSSGPCYLEFHARGTRSRLPVMLMP
jgi:hypothetical protein